MGYEKACEVPLVEQLRSAPKACTSWVVSQWSEDGREAGHHHIPFGRLMHSAADEIDSLRTQLEEQKALVAKCLARMDRTRDILTHGAPTASCNWGLLDTSDFPASAQQDAAILKAAKHLVYVITTKVGEPQDQADAHHDAQDALCKAVRGEKEGG